MPSVEKVNWGIRDGVASYRVSAEMVIGPLAVYVEDILAIRNCWTLIDPWVTSPKSSGPVTSALVVGCHTRRESGFWPEEGWP